MIQPEDDTRRFWIFTRGRCGHTVGVLTDDGYDRQRALREMYGGVRAAKKALFDHDLEVRLVDAVDYHSRYLDEIRKGCTCSA